MRQSFMPSGLSLMVIVLASVAGMAYFAYGRRQQKAAFLVAGFCLCIYPYLFDSTLALVLVGALLLAAPVLLQRR